MATGTDVYVKFGESGGTAGPRKTPLPAIEGDSTDDWHYWWCELRECGFDFEAPEHGADATAGAKQAEPLTVFKPVTLRKRLDWASTSLFQLCCEAAEAKVKKLPPEAKEGVLDRITVEVCRPGAGDKFPFLIIRYYDVRVTHFKIGMSGPEASEEITFEFEDFDYQYQQTNAFTGGKKGSSSPTKKFKNHIHELEKQEQSATAATTTAPASGPATAAASSGAVMAANPAGASGTNGSPAHASPTESVIGTVFPGFRGTTGTGVERG